MAAASALAWKAMGRLMLYTIGLLARLGASGLTAIPVALDQTTLWHARNALKWVFVAAIALNMNPQAGGPGIITNMWPIFLYMGHRLSLN